MKDQLSENRFCEDTGLPAWECMCEKCTEIMNSRIDEIEYKFGEER